MSERIARQVLLDFQARPAVHHIALILAVWADDEGRIQQISRPALSRLSGASQTTVKRALREMTEAGWLHTEKHHRPQGRGTTNAYRIGKPGHQGHNVRVLKKGACETPPKPQQERGPHRPPSTKTAKKNSNKAQQAPKKKGASQTPQVFIDLFTTYSERLDMRQDTWEQWVEYRREIGKPMTRTAAARILKKLERMMEEDGQEPWRVIHQSIENGWRGLFPVKDENENAPAGGNQPGRQGVTPKTNTQRRGTYRNGQQKTTQDNIPSRLCAHEEVAAATIRRCREEGRELPAHLDPYRESWHLDPWGWPIIEHQG